MLNCFKASLLWFTGFSVSGRVQVCLLLFMAATLAACTSQTDRQENSAMDADSPELAAIQKAVDLLYEVSGFEDVETADPEEFREAFLPTATLAYTSGGELVERTVDEYVEIRRGIMDAGEIQSLQEWELAGETVFFGNVAHRMSAYAVRVDGSDEIAERGVMSFQLLRVGGEWKVHSLTWQAESEENPLPDRYLPADR